jgi:hydroxypyruvate isomerase
MVKFAANLTMLFTEVPFMKRFALARKAGFSYVEYLFPYDYNAKDIKHVLEAEGLKQILFNIPSGNWAQGERGIAANPDRIEEFRLGVHKAIEYAVELGVAQLNCQPGKRLDRYDEAKQWSTLVANVRYAAGLLQEKGIKLLVEPLNHFDNPGVFINRTEQVLKLIEEVALPNVFLQYDIYHAQRVEGELASTLRAHINKISHIQIADNPGRHQPGTGEIHYPYLFKEIDTLGYQGYIGLEYIPTPNTNASLSWLKISVK